MILGVMHLTFVHVALSLIGIGAGFVVIGGWLAGRSLNWSTAVFLATTVATSVTGFFFPFERLLPAHILGVISLVALAIACSALYLMRLSGRWRGVYVVTAVIAQYLNFFVLIVQMFLKVPALQELAPAPSDPAQLLSQAAALIVFVGLGIAAVRRFRDGAAGRGGESS